jgi:hypothetical protein
MKIYGGIMVLIHEAAGLLQQKVASLGFIPVISNMFVPRVS